MALTLSQTGIAQTQTINAWHVTQSVDAFTGTNAYDITISGSLTVIGPLTDSISCKYSFHCFKSFNKY